MFKGDKMILNKRVRGICNYANKEWTSNCWPYNTDIIENYSYNVERKPLRYANVIFARTIFHPR